MITLSANASYGHTGQYVARITGRDSKYTFAREFIGRKGGKRNETTTAEVDTPGLYERCDVEKRGKESRFAFVVADATDREKLLFRDVNKEEAMVIAKALDSGRAIGTIVVAHKVDPEAKAVADELTPIKRMLIYSATDSELACECTLTQAIGPYVAGQNVMQSELQPVVATEIKRLTEQLASLLAIGKRSEKWYEIISAKAAEKKEAGQTIESATEACWSILQSLPEKEAKKILAVLKARVSPSKVSIV